MAAYRPFYKTLYGTFIERLHYLDGFGALQGQPSLFLKGLLCNLVNVSLSLLPEKLKTQIWYLIGELLHSLADNVLVIVSKSTSGSTTIDFFAY